MASLQKKGDGWYCQFTYKKRRYTLTIGPVEEVEARAVSAKVAYILMRIKQGLLDPQATDIVTFIKHDGKPPAVEVAEEVQKRLTFAELRDDYLTTFGSGAIEANTLVTCRIHLQWTPFARPKTGES
jgi:hypothetical protein